MFLTDAEASKTATAPHAYNPARSKAPAMRNRRLAFLLCCLSAAQLSAQVPTGSILGKVLNASGEPIENARVCIASVQGEKELAPRNCFTKTNNLGEFRIENVPLGKHAVSVQKSEEGYVPFAAKDEAAYYTTVTLTAQAPLAALSFNLRSRGGMLAAIAADQVSAAPIFNFMVHWTVHDAENPSVRLDGGSGFSRWTTKTGVPADSDLITTEVHARGYKTVKFPNPEQPQVPATIRLKPGETMTVRFELPPETETNSNTRYLPEHSMKD
jgi:Carboxypeptidase regulatory-like domain